MIFDLLHLDGRRVDDLPSSGASCWRRWSWTDRAGTSRASTSAAARAVRGRARQGLEGVVAKRLDSPYRPGKRSGEWIKARVWKRQEFVIGGHIPGEGSRAERVGSLLVGHYDKRASELKRRERQRLVFAGAVGSGLKQAEIELLTAELAKRRRAHSPFELGAPRGPKAKLAVWCDPELVCEVAWTEWTHEGTLRQPAFKGMRDDKDPREVVREA